MLFRSNLEARLRAARFAVLPDDVLTGHTADDQAETVLINLLRGTGRLGLAGMRRSGHPLLALRRVETHALCRSLGLEPIVDPTNTSSRFLRNRVRHELLPLANYLASRDVASLLARTAEVLRDDEEFLDELAAALDPTDARALAAAPTPLAQRALRRWLAEALDGYPPDLETVTRVLEVVRGHSIGTEVGRGVQVRRTGQRLRLSIMDDPAAR